MPSHKAPKAVAHNFVHSITSNMNYLRGGYLFELLRADMRKANIYNLKLMF